MNGVGSGMSCEKSNGQEGGALLTTTNNNNNHKQKCQIKSVLPVIIYTCLFVVICFVLAIVLYRHYFVCNSKECVLSTARVIWNMNESVDPCQNFYEYACGGWISREINLNYNTWNVLHQTTISAQDRLVAEFLLGENKTRLNLNEGEKAVYKVFRQCSDKNLIEAQGLNAWWNLEKEIGGWMNELPRKKNKNATEQDTRRRRRSVNHDEASLEMQLARVGDEVVAMVRDESTGAEALLGGELLHEVLRRVHRRETKSRFPSLEKAMATAFNYSVFPLFFAGVETNYRDPTRYIITIYPHLPTIPIMSHYTLKKDNNNNSITPESVADLNNTSILTLLVNAAAEMADILGIAKSSDARLRLARLIHFEWRITQNAIKVDMTATDTYDIITLQRLQRIAPMIDWRAFLSSILEIPLPNSEPVALKVGSQWMRELSTIITEYESTENGRQVVRDYINYRVLFFHLTYMPVPCDAHQALTMLLKIYNGQDHLRKVFCLMRLSGQFPLSLPSVYRKLIGKERIEKNIELVHRIAHDVKQEFRSIIQHSENLDDVTKIISLDKLNRMKILVGYPYKMDNETELLLEADRAKDTFFESMLTGAVVVYKKNLARLRSPVDPRDWQDTRPAMSSIPIHNYERNIVQIPLDTLDVPLVDIGQTETASYAAMGSIVAHEMSHGFDQQGRKQGVAGLGTTWTNISLIRVQKGERCLLNYYRKLTNNSKQNQLEQKSLNENIADQIGIEVAYQAWLRHSSETWTRITGLNIDPSKRFFITYAQTWCALENNHHSMSVHAAERYRVLGSLQNSKAFADAFSCPVGSAMNPAEKCTII